MNKNTQASLFNAIPEFKHAILRDDIGTHWLSLNKTNYQAIIAFPYFHVSSENIWLQVKCDIAKNAFIASLKTGLPVTDVLLGRSSLSQTYKNIQLSLDAYRKYELLPDFKNKKPFLLLVDSCQATDAQKRFIQKSTFLFTENNLSYYQLPYDSVYHAADALYDEKVLSFNHSNTFVIREFRSSDSLENFYYDSFDSHPSSLAYHGAGCYSGNINQYNVLYYGRLPNRTSDQYVASFWIGNFSHDQIPQSTVEIASEDSMGKTYRVEYKAAWEGLKQIDGTWALTELSFQLKNPDDKVKITVWNDILSGRDSLLIDELFIRPAATTVYRTGKRELFLNDRYYLNPIVTSSSSESNPNFLNSHR
jgi:hypothetical protein